MSLLYNAVFFSAVQQSESAVHSRVPFLRTSFPFGSPAGLSRALGHAVCSHQASVSRAASAVCTWWSPSPNPTHPHPLSTHTPVLCACVYFCSANKILSTTFPRLHSYALIAKPLTITPNSVLSVQPVMSRL